MNKKKQRLIDIFMPTTPLGWIATGVIFIGLFASPVDRLFDLLQELMDKNIGYRFAIVIVAFFISAPFYLRLRKKLRKYEEDKWDDK